VDEKEPELDFFAKQKKMAERKQLGMVDHSKIEYEEVRFNLYREAEEVKNYNPKDVQKYRKEAGDIKVRGKDIVNPVFNWYYCGFSDKTLAII
jgi:ATP-dependent RNA helicase DDX46/PRP5